MTYRSIKEPKETRNITAAEVARIAQAVDFAGSPRGKGNNHRANGCSASFSHTKAKKSGARPNRSFENKR